VALAAQHADRSPCVGAVTRISRRLPSSLSMTVVRGRARVRGQHCRSRQERQRIRRGVLASRSPLMRKAAGSITSPFDTEPPRPRRNPLPTARSHRTGGVDYLSMAPVWSSCFG